MTAYDLMISTNKKMIKGEGICDEERRDIALRLLGARTPPASAERFYAGVRHPGNRDRDGGGRMYPEFFIPPYSGGKKLKTVTGQTPKNHILSANSYELEILRLLLLLTPDDETVKFMVASTLERLRATCYGAFGCIVGECFDASLPVLRFISAAAPWNLMWIKSILGTYERHAPDATRPAALGWYFLLCLSELPDYIALPEIKVRKDELLRLLSVRSPVITDGAAKERHELRFLILRNALSRLPEYEHIKGRRPHLDPKDGRLRFDTGEHIITAGNVTPCGECCDFCGHKLEGRCAGCRASGGRECAMWESGCAIYACAARQKVDHCGLCGKFPCEWFIKTTGAWGSPGLPVLRRLAEQNGIKN